MDNVFKPIKMPEWSFQYEPTLTFGSHFHLNVDTSERKPYGVKEDVS